MSDSESEDDLTPTTVETLHAHIKKHATGGDEWTRHIRVWRQPAGQKETREEKTARLLAEHGLEDPRPGFSQSNARKIAAEKSKAQRNGHKSAKKKPEPRRSPPGEQPSEPGCCEHCPEPQQPNQPPQPASKASDPRSPRTGRSGMLLPTLSLSAAAAAAIESEAAVDGIVRRSSPCLESQSQSQWPSLPNPLARSELLAAPAAKKKLPPPLGPDERTRPRSELEQNRRMSLNCAHMARNEAAKYEDPIEAAEFEGNLNKLTESGHAKARAVVRWESKKDKTIFEKIEGAREVQHCGGIHTVVDQHDDTTAPPWAREEWVRRKAALANLRRIAERGLWQSDSAAHMRLIAKRMSTDKVKERNEALRFRERVQVHMDPCC